MKSICKNCGVVFACPRCNKEFDFIDVYLKHIEKRVQKGDEVTVQELMDGVKRKT